MEMLEDLDHNLLGDIGDWRVGSGSMDEGVVVGLESPLGRKETEVWIEGKVVNVVVVVVGVV